MVVWWLIFFCIDDVYETYGLERGRESLLTLVIESDVVESSRKIKRVSSNCLWHANVKDISKLTHTKHKLIGNIG